MNFGAIWETVLHFLRKFFSLIIAALMGLMTLLYVIGAGKVLTLEKNFTHEGFAHFLGIIFAIGTVVFYLILHIVPRKAYRLLYFLTFLLLLTMFLIGHSMGLSGPVVDDCNALGMINYSVIANARWADFGHIGVVLDRASNSTEVIGRLGEPVRNCAVQELLFASALLLLILYTVALFDVQKVLLSRVKAKTYGERFVEMGISA